MKGILILLLLLNIQTIKVFSLPSVADSNGKCENSKYLADGSNLCCNRCPPGERLAQHCSETSERVCEPCPKGQYIENWNYNPTCFTCSECKESKGLQYAQNCSSSTRMRCVCKPGMYCILGFDDPYCEECEKYKVCKVGYGVSAPGTQDSNVKCKRCPRGTFSDTTSYTDNCRPHTNCNGRAVIKIGNATSDTVCEPAATTQPETSTEKLTEFSTAVPVKTTLPVTPASQSVLTTEFINPTKSPPLNTGPDGKLAAVLGGVTGFILLFIIIIILLILCKRSWKKDAEIILPKVDANGNCDSGAKTSQCYLEETQLASFIVMSPEHQCLLEKAEGCSDHSQTSNSDHGSTNPLQSTLPLYNPQSNLSEPMTLMSSADHVIPQASIATQSSSQPTSPQIISPITTSPHVNVNITLHIGNGTCGSPSVMPTDPMQVDSNIPFGEEEESFSIPQQEAGKYSLMSVEESASYST